MQIRYFCYGCHRNKAVDVPTRLEGEDVIAWMDKVSKAIGDDHSQYSPACRSEHCDVMIAVEGDKPIGDSKEVAPAELISRVVRESQN